MRGIGISYSSDNYVLENRLLEAVLDEEELAEAKTANIALQARAVQTVYQKMRLEGEYDKSQLANNPDNYMTNNKTTLSGSSQWSDPTANVLEQFQDADATIRAKTGKSANVFHLDSKGFAGLQRNIHINERFKYSGQANIGVEQLAQYFGVEKVVVAKSLHFDPLTNEFVEIWKNNSQLAYVPPKSMQDKAVQSFGYNYVKKGFPLVEKEYFEKSDRSLHNPVLFKDKAIITDNGAGFLFMNTTA